MGRAAGMLLLCLELASLPARAQDSAGGWTLDQLMQGLSQNKGGTVDFSEDQYDAMLTRPLHSSGVLVYAAPNRLEKDTLLPKPQSVIIDGATLTMRQANGRSRTIRLQDYPQIGVLVETLRATLGGDLAGLKKANDVSLKGTADQWQLTLTPDDPALRKLVKEIRISGSHFALLSVAVLEAGGDRSMMTIAKVSP
jgi:outer membrane lipoprotein-sorting protein